VTIGYLSQKAPTVPSDLKNSCCLIVAYELVVVRVVALHVDRSCSRNKRILNMSVFAASVTLVLLVGEVQSPGCFVSMSL
jgi:hypothetical protein